MNVVDDKITIGSIQWLLITILVLKVVKIGNFK